MEFIEEKLLEYNDNKKRGINEKIKGICISVDKLYENLNELEGIDNKRFILHYAKKTSHLLEEASKRYYDWLYVQLELGLLSIDEYNGECDDARENLSDEDKFWRIHSLTEDVCEDLIMQKKWVPEKNTRDYCECKGYYDISRIEIGKLIKEELSKEYTNMKFSVTTKAEKYCTDEVHIDIVEIPSKYVEKSSIYGSEYSITQEFRMELRDFVSEFEPRVSVFIDGRFLNKSRINWRDI